LNNAPKGALPVSPTGMLALAGPQVAVLVALSVVSNILMLTGSVFMLQVYDRVLPSRSMPTPVRPDAMSTGNASPLRTSAASVRSRSAIEGTSPPR